MITYEDKYKPITSRLDKIIDLLTPTESAPQKNVTTEEFEKAAHDPNGVYVTREDLAKAWDEQWSAEDTKNEFNDFCKALGLK